MNEYNLSMSINQSIFTPEGSCADWWGNVDYACVTNKLCNQATSHINYLFWYLLVLIVVFFLVYKFVRFVSAEQIVNSFISILFCWWVAIAYFLKLFDIKLLIIVLGITSIGLFCLQIFLNNRYKKIIKR